MTDANDPKRRMFGDYRLKPNSGVNPPYSPAYPVEWGCTLRTVEIMTRVAPAKVAKLLADTPFEIAASAWPFASCCRRAIRWRCMPARCST